MTTNKSSSAVYVLLQQISGLLIHLVQIVVLSRLLSPADFGLAAMASTFFAMINVVRDFGFSISAIQAKEVSHRDSSNLFWIGLMISAAMAGVLAAASPLIAAFFREPIVTWLMLWMALTYIIECAGNQPTALAQRAFRFKSLAILDIVSKAIGLACGIAMALAGLGVWSIVGLHLVTTTISSVGAFGVSGFWPGRIGNVAQTKRHLHSGAWLTVAGLLSFFAQNIDNILVARFFGAQALGFYARAFGLLIFPMRTMLYGFKRYNLATFSRLVDAPAVYEKHLSLTLHFYLLVSSLFIVPMAACPDDVVLLALGNEWAPVAPIFQILAPFAWAQVVYQMCNLCLISHGKMKCLSTLHVWNCLISIVAIIAAVPFGVLGMAASFSITGVCVRQPLYMYFAWKEKTLNLVPFLQTLLPNAAISVLAFLSCLTASHAMVDYHPVLRLAAVTVLSGLIMLPCSLLTKAGYQFFWLLLGKVVHTKYGNEVAAETLT